MRRSRSSKNWLDGDPPLQPGEPLQQAHRQMNHRPTRPLRVLIYTPQLLPVSQPWAYQHAAMLPETQTGLVGRKLADPSIDISPLHHYALEPHRLGGIEAILYLMSGASPRLQSFARSFAPDIVHAHFGPGGTEIMNIAHKLDVPLIVSFHGYDAWIADGGRPRTFYERLHLHRRTPLFRQAQLVLTCSHWLRRRVIDLGCPPAQVETHYLGVDRAVFDGRRANDGGHRIAMVGRLIPIKGFDLALESIRLLKARVPDVTVEIIGGGPDHDRLQKTVDTHTLPVRLHGPGSQSAVRDLFARSRVHCLTSTVSTSGKAEGFGLVAVEAQAMGLPVVATATGGVPEALVDGSTGILVPDGDPQALADALELLLADGPTHARMSAAAQELVADKFDSRDSVKRLHERYVDLLSKLGRLP